MQPSIPPRRAWTTVVVSSRFLRLVASAAVVFAVAGPTPAQDAPAAPPAAASATQRLARVTVDQQPLRCFASEHSPVFVDQLAAGDVVQIGDASNGFVPVTLPLGVTGYVHKKFATPPDEAGFVRTNGKRVSFRYRPRSNEAPAELLEENVPLHLMAEESEWYVVRYPRGLGWVPEAAVAVATDEAAAREGLAKLETQRREQWQRVVSERAAAAAAEVALAENRGKLQEVVGAFRSEVGKPWAEQARDRLQAIEASAKALDGKFADGSTEQVTLASLGQEIRKQMVILDAQHVAKEALPPKPPSKILTPPVEDPTARFDLVGWVRMVNSSIPSRSVRLVRGGRVLGYLTCTSGRYDFSMFDGVEVGVSGPKEAAADGAWLLDVQRLDVLGLAR